MYHLVIKSHPSKNIFGLLLPILAHSPGCYHFKKCQGKIPTSTKKFITISKELHPEEKLRILISANTYLNNFSLSLLSVVRYQEIIWPLRFCTSVSKLEDPNTDWAVQEGYVCFWLPVGAKGHKLAHRLKWNTHIKISRHKEGNF